MYVTWDQLLQVLLLIVEGKTLVCNIKTRSKVDGYFLTKNEGATHSRLTFSLSLL